MADRLDIIPHNKNIKQISFACPISYSQILKLLAKDTILVNLQRKAKVTVGDKGECMRLSVDRLIQ